MMKKLIALGAAIGLATAANAYQQTSNNSDDGLIAVASTPKTETYDGANSAGLPGQPAPEAGYQAPNNPAADGGEYQFCSDTIRDNCRQRRDPSYSPN